MKKLGKSNYDDAASLKPKAPYDEMNPVELAVLYEVEDGSVETIDEDSEESSSNGRRRTKKIPSRSSLYYFENTRDDEYR